MNIFKFIFSITVLLFLISCTDERTEIEENPNNPDVIVEENQGEALDEDIDDLELDYSIYMYCPNHFNTFHNYNNLKTPVAQPDNHKGFLLNNYNNLIDTLYDIPVTLSTDLTALSAKNTNDDDKISNYEKIIKNKENLLIASCIYEKYANINNIPLQLKMLIPLNDKNNWHSTFKFYETGHPTNNNLFIPTVLTDLYFEIYTVINKYNYDINTSIQLINSFMTSNFNNTLFDKFKLSDAYPLGEFASDFENENSTNSVQLGKFFELSLTYTDSDINLLNQLIAQEYKNVYLDQKSCNEVGLCASIFKDKIFSLTQNDSFTNKLDFWTIEKNLDDLKDNSYIRTPLSSISPLSYKVQMGIEFTNNIEDPMPNILAYQTYELSSPDDLKKIIFEIESTTLLGGTSDPIFGGITNSGLAGYYICFEDDNNKNLACMMIENHLDKITIDGIYIADYFKVESTSDMYYEYRNGPFITSRLLDDIIEQHFPVLKNSKEKISYVTYGTYVGGISPDGRTCLQCKADLEVERFGLYKYQD